MGRRPRIFTRRTGPVKPSGCSGSDILGTRVRAPSRFGYLCSWRTHQTHRDLFVTSCQDLLALQSRVPEANVTDLCSALRIIGLYLRSSGDFTIRAFPKGRHTLDRELFYWVLCRHRLPAMWRYFSACLQRDRDTPNANEQLGDLAGTILTRCLRALQARDEVGFRFYRRQNNTTRSEMLYHFDYLTLLLLAGAFDAGARIARLVCGLEDINLRAVNFRSQQFRQALRANGASSLGDVIDNRSFQMFQRVSGRAEEFNPRDGPSRRRSGSRR